MDKGNILRWWVSNSKITDTLLLGKSLKFSKQYYANGHLQSTAFYNDTLLEGKYSYFHDNGKLWTERIYKQGKLLEVLNNFDRLGKKGNPGTLKNGNGRLYLYNEEGRIVESIEYVDGMPKKAAHNTVLASWRLLWVWEGASFH